MVIELGSVVEGVVSRITPFGAFVDIEGGKNGLIHISEISNVYVKDVHDFLAEGDKIQAKVVSIDDRGKIALSLKQMKQNQEQNQEISSMPPPRNKFARSDRVERNISDNRKPLRPVSASFEDKLSKFMKDSDERQADIKRKTDSKRGGRGSRRSD